MPSAYKIARLGPLIAAMQGRAEGDFRKRVKVRFIITGCQLLCLESPCSGFLCATSVSSVSLWLMNSE